MENINYSISISCLTPKRWASILLLLRLSTKKTTDSHMKPARGPVVLNQNWTLDPCDFETADSRYRNYINSVLTELHNGNKDYCYYIYQVKELLRFHPELKAKLVTDGNFKYIEVSLPKERGDGHKK